MDSITFRKKCNIFFHEREKFCEKEEKYKDETESPRYAASPRKSFSVHEKHERHEKEIIIKNSFLFFYFFVLFVDRNNDFRGKIVMSHSG